MKKKRAKYLGLRLTAKELRQIQAQRAKDETLSDCARRLIFETIAEANE